MTERAEFVEEPGLRDRLGVFRDRDDAGRVLAGLLEGYRGTDALVLAIPAGGIPVGARAAEDLGLDLDVAVVSKITLPWNTEAGYGAVAFDGTVRLNEALLPHLGLTDRDAEQGIEKTRQKVARRVRAFRGDRPLPDLSDRPAILVDDGLASGFTVTVAVEALRNAGAREVAVAVPTGHLASVERLAPRVEGLYCANIRGGGSFAVASAYLHWCDVSEEEARTALERFRGSHGRK